MIGLNTICSRDNKFIKHAKKLKTKKYRNEANEFLVEGVRFVEEGVMANANIKYCLCSEEVKNDRFLSLVDNIKHSNIPLYYVENSLLNEICDTETPQGIVGIVEKKSFEIEDIINDGSFIILVDRIQDPGNMGTIIRTADAAGADGIILSQGTVDPYSTKVLRSTMGSIFHLPIAYDVNLTEAIEMLKKKEFYVYASSLDGDTMYYEEDYTIKTGIIIGNEANGIGDEILQSSSKLIKIPMPGRAESLNAAVACGILVFEVVKQRNLR